jgi:hypothetical protein
MLNYWFEGIVKGYIVDFTTNILPPLNKKNNYWREPRANKQGKFY